MARKEKTYTVEGGRDDGKTFLITEMPVIKADAWATRVLFAIAKSGIDTAGINPNGGMLEMVKVAITTIGNIDHDEGYPLLNELLDCVQIIPSGGTPRKLNIDSDIQEVRTLMMLRKESLMLHLDFLDIGSFQNEETH
ncbi:hypothetical protein AAEX37_01954 [Oligella sp. MSHR50489EDL]|uniref:hypothetical protein n=1 Tax=Oligella sp. MSHR50489EDL TaxID=3139409 RepID=UPI003D815C91